jgi:HEAT repeat protein
MATANPIATPEGVSERALPLGHSATPPLPPSEEPLFRAAARWAGDPMELADSLHIPYTELLAWLDQPHIHDLLEVHDRFTARCEANRARQAQATVASTLATDFHETQDPKERRRIAGPLLRANTPPRTLLARAGASPANRSKGVGRYQPRPTPAREAADPQPQLAAADDVGPGAHEADRASNRAPDDRGPSGFPKELESLYHRTCQIQSAYCAGKLPEDECLRALDEWSKALLAHSAAEDDALALNSSTSPPSALSQLRSCMRPVVRTLASCVAVPLWLTVLSCAAQVSQISGGTGAVAAPYPRDGGLSATSKWLQDQYGRLARAGSRPGGAECVVTLVVPRPEILPPAEWARLSTLCAVEIASPEPWRQLEGLQFAGWALRAAAAADTSLPELFTPDLLSSMIAALSSGDPPVRKTALAMLGGAQQFSPEPLTAVPALLSVLDDPDPATRRTAAQSLESIARGRGDAGLGPHGSSAVAALLRRIDDPDRGVRVFSCAALGSMADAGRAAVPALAARLGNGDAQTARLAMRALQSLGPRAAEGVPAIASQLRNSDENVRMQAARTLGSVGPAAWSAVGAMISALDDPSGDVAAASAHALGQIGPLSSEAVPRLRAALSVDPNAFEGEAASALRAITGEPGP